MMWEDGSKGPLQEKYATASAVFGSMNKLGKLWIELQIGPQLRRSDLALLGALLRMSQQGTKKVTISALAHKMEQSKPGISQKVNALEKQGFLRRTADKEDRRVVYVQLTPKGLNTTKETFEKLFNEVEKALHQLGEEKTEQLLSLMDELNNAMESVIQKSEESQKGERT